MIKTFDCIQKSKDLSKNVDIHCEHLIEYQLQVEIEIQVLRG